MTEERHFVIIKKLIIQWFKEHGRRYAWRRTKDAYQILMAEMLLRRTTATAVSRIFPSFLRKYPSPHRLAETDLPEIVASIRSLGLQHLRGTQLKETAQIVLSCHEGNVPREFGFLLDLPGLGKYGASAVLNFAFSQKIPVVDGNIVHLLNRLLGTNFASPADEEVWSLMASFGAPDHSPQLYWGMIDLVATICLRRTPRCNQCPLVDWCDFYKSNSVPYMQHS